MATFSYKALNTGKETISGEIEAENVAQAVARLEAEGFDVQSIANSPAGWPTERVEATNAAPSDLRRLTAEALQKGRSIVPAIRAVAEESHRTAQHRELVSVANVLERGNVDEAVAAISALPEYWIPILTAAAKSHDSRRLLFNMLARTERTNELRRQWRQTLSYPLLGVVACIVVFVILSFTVLPSFEHIYASFGLRLPDATLITFRLAKFVTSVEGLIVGIILLAIALIVLAICRSRSAAGQSWPTSWLRLPVARWAVAGQVAGFVADLMEAGLDGATALQTAAFASGRRRVQTAAADAIKCLQSGKAISPTTTRVLTASVVQALRAETPTASRVRVLRELSQMLGERSGELFSWSRGLAGPVTVIFVGLMVGFVVLSLYIPMISLVQNLTGGPR